ncbi:Gfo/Idh/MocA family protein [Ruegeria lacuscaerulensis]|uniref:Gfo/Idh/MocA family protein n=1 Tax=Ruegeria lacuscaerulensis TaxID=55218 RepID=UPI00147F9B21|nr:Gfo/Idh/MocA family oxidoreductase [Ruegeria lacuscaerulensis]
MTPLKLGMVGGGKGAFIGAVHRIAARLDGQWQLVAGALSSDPQRAAASAQELGLDRSYADFRQMAQAEAARDDGIDAVAIVTPNHMHADPAIAFLEAGIHVICDKPLSATAEDAARIKAAAEASSAHFILTHNYTGYPMIRQAREMVQAGELGKLRLVQVEYAQDWLTEPADADNKQADWRTDPARSGAGAIGDIGTHAFNLAHFVTGEVPSHLAADLSSMVPGRQVDDNAHILLRYGNGVRGMLWASQVAVGNENGLRLRVYGDKGGLEWSQEHPNHLYFSRFGEPTQVLTRGSAATSETACAATRIPPGHPEGYLEGFATIYKDAAALIRKDQDRQDLLPELSDGLLGMAFISAALKSSDSDGVWQPVSIQ